MLNEPAASREHMCTIIPGFIEIGRFKPVEGLPEAVVHNHIFIIRQQQLAPRTSFDRHRRRNRNKGKEGGRSTSTKRTRHNHTPNHLSGPSQSLQSLY